MKFGLLVSEGPYTHQASDSAYQFALATGDTEFLRLTDTQLFLIRQWAAGKFINEQQESIADGQAEQLREGPTPEGHGKAEEVEAVEMDVESQP